MQGAAYNDPGELQLYSLAAGDLWCRHANSFCSYRPSVRGLAGPWAHSTARLAAVGCAGGLRGGDHLWVLLSAQDRSDDQRRRCGGRGIAVVPWRRGVLGFGW